MMKLTYRDKVIAIVLTVVLLIAAGAIFLIKPKIEEFQSAEIALDAKKQEQQTVQSKIDTLAMVQANVIRSLDAIQKYQEPFYEEMSDYELEQLFHEYCNEGEFEIKTLTMNVSPYELVAYQYQPEIGILAYDMKIHGDIYNELPQEVMDIYNDALLNEKPFVEVGAMVIEAEMDNMTYWNEVTPLADLLEGLDRTIIVRSIAKGADADPSKDKPGTSNFQIIIFNIKPMDVETIIEEELEIAEDNGTQEPLKAIIDQFRAGTLEAYTPPPVTESGTDTEIVTDVS
jgi:hypothetical protein